MPDISNADLVGLAGTFVASIIAGLGLKRGGQERDSLPAPNESMAAGVFVGMDALTERSILEEIRAMHADQVRWRVEDQAEKRAEKQEAELQDAREEAQELRTQIADLRAGQRTTHVNQDDLRAMIEALLKDSGPYTKEARAKRLE